MGEWGDDLVDVFVYWEWDMICSYGEVEFWD